MVASKPQFISPLQLAERQEKLTGSIPVSALRRLREVLYNSKGGVNYELHFGKDDQGQVFIKGTFSVMLNLRCQRCMQPMDLMIENRICLGVVNSEDAGCLSERYEPIKLVDNQILLETLLEEEILLAMPIAPVHEQDSCRGDALMDKYKAGTESPFAVLKNLKIEK